MATRFYFTSDNGVSVPTITVDASWEASTAFRGGLSKRRLGSPFSEKNKDETSTSGTYDVEVWQFTSQPLAAQTISGTVKAIMRCRESNAAANFRSQMNIRVVSGDGGTVRGTLLAHDASALSNEWDATTLTNRKFPLNWAGAGAALSSVAAQAGDRIVVEIGYRAHNTVSTQYYGYIEAGDAASVDCAENETDTLQRNPWVEFSQTLAFQDGLSRHRGGKENLISPEERKPLSQKSVQFGGTDEYVTMGNVLGFERTSPRSFSLWVRWAGSGGSQMLLSKDLGVPTYQGFEIESNGGTVAFSMMNSVGNRLLVVAGNGILIDGRWHHVVVTTDGSSVASGVQIYIDGELGADRQVWSDTLTATILTSASFVLGVRSSLDATFLVGNLDDVAVYSKALSADEVKMLSQGYSPSVVAAANLVGYWKMGDGDTFPTLLDSSSSGFNGTMTFMEAGDIQNDVPMLPVWPSGGVYANALLDEMGTSSLDQLSVERRQREDLVSELGAPSPFMGHGEYATFGLTDLETTSNAFLSERRPEFAMSGGVIIAPPEPGGVVYYKMRAQQSVVPLPGYVTWVVQDNPDFAGAGYSTGEPTPSYPMVPGSVVVAATWQE